VWFVVDYHSPVPIYVQIKEKVKVLILSGKLKPGDFLPSIRTLAKDLGVNVNTVARAYRELELEGVIRAERGEGYTVVGLENAVHEKIKQQIITELESVLRRCKELKIDKSTVFSLVEKIYQQSTQSSHQYKEGENNGN
jgi:GntR family transcriptional regulator